MNGPGVQLSEIHNFTGRGVAGWVYSAQFFDKPLRLLHENALKAKGVVFFGEEESSKTCASAKRTHL